MNGAYKNAIKCAEEAHNQFSYNPLFKLRHAQGLSALGNLKDALNILNELEKSGLSSFELVLTKASVFSMLKDKKMLSNISKMPWNLQLMKIKMRCI